MIPRPLTEAALAGHRTSAPQRPADLALRLAQRAFAALIEHAARTSGGAPALRALHLHRAARRTLSALSADDRARLARWLALQFAACGADPAQHPLARVDAGLSARLGAALPRAQADLVARDRARAAAA